MTDHREIFRPDVGQLAVKGHRRPKEELERQPYTAVIRVENLAPGTGWFISDRTIVTAAHVVGAPPFKNLTIQLLNGQEITEHDRVHYLAGSHANVRTAGANDVAIIVLNNPIADVRILAIGTYREGAEVSLHGYVRPVPHFSEGESAAARPYLCYNAGTISSFSGAPVRQDGDVVAIHLGWRGTEAPELLNEWPEKLKTEDLAYNYGVLIEGEVLEFLSEHIYD